MIQKRINAKALLGLALLLIVVGVAGALMSPGREPDRTISARIGDVTWNHEQHARMEEIPNCQVCHHQEREGTTNPRPCSTCHQVRDDHDLLIQADLFMDVPAVVYEGEHGPPPMTAFHAKCIGCHEALEKGPVLCRDCHTPGSAGDHGRATWNHYAHSRKFGIDAGPGTPHSECVTCHHHDTEAETDGDYRPCSVCHEPAAARGEPTATGLKGIDGVAEVDRHLDVLHGECAECHTETNPENDIRTCKDCHEPWGYDVTQRELPNLEQAIHQRCHECHNADYEDLNERMPTTCNGCHEADPSWLVHEDFGHVFWSHERHGRYRDMECETCHHQDLPGEPHLACRSCHGTGLFDNPSLGDALEERCIGCHRDKQTGLERWDLLTTNEPTVELFRVDAPEGSFWWNHHSHALGDAFSCQECHHNVLREDGEYVTARRAGKAWPEEAMKFRGCAACHGDDGPVAGSAAEGTDAPVRLDALRKVCVECHQRLGGGPQSWEEFFIEPQIDWETILEAAPETIQEAAR